MTNPLPIDQLLHEVGMFLRSEHWTPALVGGYRIVKRGDAAHDFTLEVDFMALPPPDDPEEVVTQ